MGTSGPSSTDAIYPNMLSYLFGMKFKVIGGYKSATTVHVAMERGEVDGRCGISWDTLQALYPTWLKEKKVRLLLQIGLDRVPQLSQVPFVLDMAKSEEQRQIISLWAAPLKMGRPFFAPPGMPAERARLLRRAFDATLKDPALLAEAAKSRISIEPLTGEQVAALIQKIYATPKAIVAKAALASKGE